MVKVRVPATTANMGAGFDCLGAALSLYNYTEAEIIDDGLEIIIKNNNSRNTIPTDETNLVYKTMKYLFNKANKKIPPLKITQENNIPVTRGLGSSSASIVGALICANKMLGGIFSKNELLLTAAKLEGHSDNSTSAFLGGFNISVIENGNIFYDTHKITDDLKFLVVIPDFQVMTSKARNVLPPLYSIEDAKYNISRAAMFSTLMATGSYDMLRYGMGDKIHEPYRSKFIDGYELVVKKAEEAGTLGTYISGSGPTLVSLVKGKNANEAKKIMSEFLNESYPKWQVLLLNADNEGAVIIN